LPESNEFSAGIVDLKRVLTLVHAHPGDRGAQIEALRAEYFHSSAAARTDGGEREQQQRTRAYNVLVGMKGYGLYSLSDGELTALGQNLLAMDDSQRMAAFVRHVLLERHGMQVLRAVRSMQERGVRVTKNSLDAELRQRGFTTLPRATTHHTDLLNWIAQAGAIEGGGRYGIDEDRVADLTGIRFSEIDEWNGLTRAQHAFLRTLRRLADAHGTNSVAAHDLIDAVAYEHGPVFKQDQLRASVFRPLAEAGWLEATGLGTGRGGKSGRIAATPKLLAADFEALTGYARGKVPADLQTKLDTPLEQIAADLTSADTHVKGLALELLAMRLAIDLGLVPVRFRLRSARTGGGEVDLLAEGAHLHFSRWLLQCKNKKTVSLADLAKEVGMATLLHGHVIVMVTTGAFSSSVTTYAAELSTTTALQTVLVDGRALRRYLASGQTWLLGYFHESAQATMSEKRPQALEAIDEADGE